MELLLGMENFFILYYGKIAISRLKFKSGGGLMVQKSCQKSNCKAKYKVKKILFYDSGTFSENISHFDHKSMDVLWKTAPFMV